MPSPLLLARPSGLYVRFLVPLSLRPLVGQRFLVRPLHAPSGDAARLVAARMAVALSNAFAKLREGVPVDLKKALDAAASKAREDLTIGTLTLPNGVVLSNVEINTPEDQAMFDATVARMGGATMGESAIPSNAPMLSQAIADHLADLTNAKRAPKTVMESRHTLRLLRSAVGSDIPVSQLSQAHARAALDMARHWPANASVRKEYKNLTPMEVVALSKKNGEPTPADHTIKKHRQRLSVFFNALLEGKHLVVNPLKGIPDINAKNEEETGRPFTDDELRAIFDESRLAAWGATEPHQFWPPILGLYSGARVSEIAQLYVGDIERVDGVWGFHINERYPGQKVKGKNSRRFVPLAAPVLATGFLDYVERVRELGHERLFPDLPNATGLGFGRKVSKDFSRYIKGQAKVVEDGLGFHAFRHTFVTTLERLGVPLSRIGAITGHAGGGTVIERFYVQRQTLPERVETLSKFAPPVTLPKYRPGQFDASLKNSPKKFRIAKPSPLRSTDE